MGSYLLFKHDPSCPSTPFKTGQIIRAYQKCDISLFSSRKYQEYLLQKFEEDLRALLNQFVAQRKIEALAEQNRREREAAEKTFRQNQKKMEKLEQETIRVTNRLAESSRLAEQREKINRDHVQTLTNQMNNARAEFRQIYEGRLQAQEQRIAEERQQKEQALQEYEAQLEESRRQQEALQNRMARQEQENEDRQREMNRELKEIRDKANERKWWQFWKYF